MNLLEYQAKKLLSSDEIVVPRSWLVKSAGRIPNDVSYPVVVKSQVPVGGRGKLGGVVIANDENELSTTTDKLFELDIKGHLPTALLLESVVEIERELYLSIRLNRDNGSIEVMSSQSGGIDIEQSDNPPLIIDIDDDQLIIKTANNLAVDETQLSVLLSALIHKFNSRDLLLLEINPLVVTSRGDLVCADAKVTVDDNARFRQPNFPWPEVTGNNMQVLSGTIGCIANGAGMAMSTMDTITAMGGKPANFLDIGGGTGEKEFITALRSVSEIPGVTSIIVNIFAGISRCDEIARGLITASQQLQNLQPVFVRLEGTNRDIAVELLKNAGIEIQPDLRTCINKSLALSRDTA